MALDAQPADVRPARNHLALQFLVAPTEVLAVGGSDVVCTIREQKHILHHRSHRCYRHRPQSARRVLAPGFLFGSPRSPKTVFDLEELICSARARTAHLLECRTVDDE
jgi:hypothetical protein